MTPSEVQVSQSSSPAAAGHGEITVGWVVKRSALWLLIVATAVSAACLLYAAAGAAEQPGQAIAGAPTEAETR
jgi:hypothetical protein